MVSKSGTSVQLFIFNKRYTTRMDDVSFSLQIMPEGKRIQDIHSQNKNRFLYSFLYEKRQHQTAQTLAVLSARGKISLAFGEGR
jgi:hypothetical protein